MFVFLDIDGVLNTEADWNRPFQLNDACVKRFGEAYRNERVILISSWRNGFVSAKNAKNTTQIRELEDKLSKYNIRIVGKTEDVQYRDEAVSHFLKNHPSITEYIIIDDDSSEYKSRNTENLMLVNSKTGFLGKLN